MNLIVSLRKELLEAWRGKRFLVAVVLLGAFGMMSPLLAKFMREIFSAVPGAEMFSAMIPEPTIMDAIGQYVKNIEQFGILLALLLSMGLVAVEKERGTAGLMLSKPLSRSAFITAKFLGLAVILLVALAVAALGGYYYTLALFGPLSPGAWLGLNGSIWLLTLVVAAITLLFSTLFSSQAAAAGVALGVYLLISLFGNIPAVSPYIPDRVVAWGVSLFTPQVGNGWPAAGVCLGVIVVCLMSACFVFKRQEL
ncbi:MAG: ABC transporter permease subunit [Anaerolineaceae bacterium]